MLRALATAVQDGRVSASDLIEAAVARIREHDRVINAVPFTDHAAAASAAAEIDALPLRQRRRLPLAGIPFLAKDMDDVAGWHTTFGSPAYRSNPLAPHDAPTVGRLRGAGAVPVGRSNTCEFAHEGHCSSPLYGDTRNPWQPDWSSGGSSGGSAAALAAGLVPLTTASDGGGSIRIPAALCGLVGLKPTTGSIASSPSAPWLDVHSDGVLAPVVDDVDLVMSVLSPPWRQNRPVTAVDRIVVVPRLTPAAEPSDATLRVVRSAAVDLARRFAARLEDTTIECLYSDEPHLPGRWESDWYDLTSAEHAQLVGREKVEAHRADWDPTFLESLEHGLDLPAAQYVEARRRAAVTGLLTDAVLSPGTVLVAPVMSGPGYSPDGRAPGHSSPGSPAGHTHTVLANLGGQPALSLPAGVDNSGVPRGIQVVARRGDDGILMTVARAWERLHPWPLAAPGYTPFTLGELRA